MNSMQPRTLLNIKGFVAATALVFLTNASALPLIWALKRVLPKGTLAGASDNPFITLFLFVLSAFGSVLLVAGCAALGAMVWLIIMKFLYSRAEMIMMLGLNLGKPTLGKRLIKGFLELVF